MWRGISQERNKEAILRLAIASSLSSLFRLSDLRKREGGLRDEEFDFIEFQTSNATSGRIGSSRRRRGLAWK